MEKSSRRTALLLFWFVIVSLQIPRTIGDKQTEDEQTYITKTLSRLQEMVSMLQKSHQVAWEKMRTTIADMQMQFRPPNLDFKGDDRNDASEEGMGEKVREAAQKSFETSKNTVEESAKTAAETVHKTAEKVREVVNKDESTSEL